MRLLILVLVIMSPRASVRHGVLYVYFQQNNECDVSLERALDPGFKEVYVYSFRNIYQNLNPDSSYSFEVITSCNKIFWSTQNDFF